MEMNGKKTIKKAKKLPQWIIIGYIICIIAIVGAAFLINYKKQTQTSKAIDYTTNGGIGVKVNQYAYLDVQGLSYEIAEIKNDRYYLVSNKGILYLVDLNQDIISQLKEWQEYYYSQGTEETLPEPESAKIYGVTETVPEDLKKIVVDFCNKDIPEEQQIKIEEYEKYFGSTLLNARKNPINITPQKVIIIIASIGLIVFTIIYITLFRDQNKVKKYLKKNKYEEDLAHQLDDLIEEQHYEEKLIITKDFLVDLKYGGFIAFKYADVKWVYQNNVKILGITTGFSNITVHLRDGKTKLACAKIIGKQDAEFTGIFNTICKKSAKDVLKGYNKNTKKAFKQYKKDKFKK